MFSTIISKFKKMIPVFVGKNKEIPVARRILTPDEVKKRLEGLGWSIAEYPFKSYDKSSGIQCIFKWKVTAVRNGAIYSCEYKTKEEAIMVLGKMLGASNGI